MAVAGRDTGEGVRKPLIMVVAGRDNGEGKKETGGF
jgi:hypothetical protein